MKQRDRILFLTPLAAAFLVLLFAGLFVHQLNLFENSFFANANNSIRQETALVAAILLPLLNEGRLEEAVAFCNDFDRDSLRLSLIRPDGTVEADSAEKAGFLGNHLERDEVQAALRGNPICTTRFSESLNLWMTYHALKLQTAHGDFIVRAAVSTDKAARIITLAKRTVYLALLFGAALVSLLTAYILSKVRRPLRALQNSLANISRGDLDTRIPVPADGIVRDIALGVAEMTAQLKKHLAEMTRERNIREDILDAMTEAVLLLNADGEAQKINQSGRTMFKIPPGGKFNIARSGINGLLPSLHQTLQTGKPFEQEFNLTEVNGSRILLVKCCCLAPDGKPGLLLTISDLTGIRRLETFRSDFIANVSHELKTPLTCIIGAAEAIRKSTDLPRERLERYIDMLYTQSLRLSLLVQDILSLSALEKRQRDSQKDFMPWICRTCSSMPSGNAAPRPTMLISACESPPAQHWKPAVTHSCSNRPYRTSSAMPLNTAAARKLSSR